MSLFKYFSKTLTSVSTSEGKRNEGSARHEDSESCATETETLLTSIACKGGRNVKRKSQTVSTPKRRRWNDDYVKCGFRRSTDDKHNQYPLASCLFCAVKHANSNRVPSKLEVHLQKHHPEHQYKSKKFFESQLLSIRKQQRSFELQMIGKESKDIVLASFKMAHVVLKSKRPYTELETSNITMS